jgi:predicted DCC family thiol-disulfide oxidoreductase YuxK
LREVKNTCPPPSHQSSLNRQILFYDGDCALCNRSVQFTLKHEKNHELFFSALQSNFAKTELEKHGYDFSQMGTFALIIDSKVYYKSDAALNLSKFLKVPQSWFIVLKIVPKFIRDAVYDMVARNRKKWFKKEFCFLPDTEMKKRFLE